MCDEINRREPLVSVLLPVYNAEEFVAKTLESILKQTHRNWELVIVNDCSTDNSLEILKSFKDKRFRIFSNDRNKKLIYSLNRMLGLARGKYLARIDADDLCEPQRFERQVHFLEKNPEVGLCASNAVCIDEKERSLFGGRTLLNIKEDLEHNYIFWKLFFYENPVIHPSVMFRKTTLEESGCKYSEDAVHVEDFELWCKLRKHCKFHILAEPLIRYRMHSNSVTALNNAQQIKRVLKINHRELSRYIGNGKRIEAFFPSGKGGSLLIQLATLNRLYHKFAGEGGLDYCSNEMIKRDLNMKLLQLLFFSLKRRPLEFLSLLELARKNRFPFCLNHVFSSLIELFENRFKKRQIN